MGTKTGIEWCDSTWNPIRGCSPVSAGCQNCGAATVAGRFSHAGGAYEGLVRINAAGERTDEWNGNIRFVEEHLLDPLRWGPVREEIVFPDAVVKRQRRRRIFVNSVSDLFHENVTDAMRDRIFAVMALCPQHDFLVLTKRPARMLEYLTAHGLRQRIYSYATLTVDGNFDRFPLHMAHHRSSGAGWWPLPNLWLGVSVESQAAADERIPLLLQTPAAVRFVSAEPLLGPVDLESVDSTKHFGYTSESRALSGLRYVPGGGSVSSSIFDAPSIDWVIAGGESGPGARPMRPDWARGLRDQCQAVRVPFFFKQWGEWLGVESVADGSGFRLNPPSGIPLSAVGSLNKMVRWESDVWRHPRKHETVSEFMGAGSTLSFAVGKKKAGSLLDGREWKQFPEVRG